MFAHSFFFLANRQKHTIAGRWISLFVTRHSSLVNPSV
jgi:hypothetical protein